MRPSESVAANRSWFDSPSGKWAFVIGTILLSGLVHGGIHFVDSWPVSSTDPAKVISQTTAEHMAVTQGVEVGKEAELHYWDAIAKIDSAIKRLEPEFAVSLNEGSGPVAKALAKRLEADGFDISIDTKAWGPFRAPHTWIVKVNLESL